MQKHEVRVTGHALAQYRMRFAREPPLCNLEDWQLRKRMLGEVASATPLSSAQMLVFLHPRRGLQPDDQYVQKGDAIYVLQGSKSGARRTCRTVIRASDAQIATMADIADDAA